MTRKTPLGISNQLTTPTTAFAAKPVVQVFATPSSESRLPVCPLNLGRSHAHSDGPVPRSNSPIARDWSKPASYVFILPEGPNPLAPSLTALSHPRTIWRYVFPPCPTTGSLIKATSPLNPTSLPTKARPWSNRWAKITPLRSPCRSLSSFEDSRATRRLPLRRIHDDLNKSRFLIDTRGQAVLISPASLGSVQSDSLC